MTPTSQDDHLTARACAACDCCSTLRANSQQLNWIHIKMDSNKYMKLIVLMTCNHLQYTSFKSFTEVSY